MKIRKSLLIGCLTAFLGIGAAVGAGVSAEKAPIKVAEATMDVYFTRPTDKGDDWKGTLYIHYWGSSETQWPGNALVHAYNNDQNQQVMKATIPDGTTGMIFNAGNGKDQTANITTNIANNKGFYISGGDYKNRTVETWDVQFYTLAFNANGGTGSMASHNAVRDINWGVPDNEFTRAGYEFTGWNTAANGKGTAYAVGSTITKNTQAAGSTLTLYAQWKQIQYHVVGNNKGNWSPSGPGAVLFEASGAGQYKAENLTFISGEQWKIIKGSDGWVESGYNTNKDIFDTYMYVSGGNVNVTAAGAAFRYSIYININPSTYEITEIWVAFFYNAEKFATELMSNTDSICASNQGHNASALKPVWASMYADLSNYPQSEINKLKNADAKEDGSTIEQGMARYDKICKIYGTALEQSPKTYSYNFLGRNSANKQSMPSILPGLVDSNGNISNGSYIWIIVVSAVAVASVGAFFFIKKRKEDK